MVVPTPSVGAQVEQKQMCQLSPLAGTLTFLGKMIDSRAFGFQEFRLQFLYFPGFVTLTKLYHELPYFFSLEMVGYRVS